MSVGAWKMRYVTHLGSKLYQVAVSTKEAGELFVEDAVVMAMRRIPLSTRVCRGSEPAVILRQVPCRKPEDGGSHQSSYRPKPVPVSPETLGTKEKLERALKPTAPAGT